VPATLIVAITAVAASTGAVDAIEVESLVGDWGFEVGAENIYQRLSPPPDQWMQKRLHLWLEIGDLKSLGALGAIWELSGSSLGACHSCAYKLIARLIY
jgi:hypothetical protein